MEAVVIGGATGPGELPPGRVYWWRDQQSDALRRRRFLASVGGRTDAHGPVMFHQSGGCCDGSSPMCYPDGDFLLSDADVHLGDLDIGLERAVPVWMSKAQFNYWSHTHLTIDVVPGRGAGFSLEVPEGVRFLIRSRMFTDDEADSLRPLS